MERIHTLIGRESGLNEVARQVRDLAGDAGARAVGAMHVTCADESEVECVEAFRRGVVEPLLPELKTDRRRCFRLANLGARYEWGAVHIADDHYTTGTARRESKLVVVKLNSHVAADPTGGGTRFGRMKRYDSESSFCGALHHMLDGGGLPCAADLREAFGSEGLDRVALLNDPGRVGPAVRSLLAAVVNARVQGRQLVFDLALRPPETATRLVVVLAVTLNRPGPDGEIVTGVYDADYRGERPTVTYRGLGDDPSRMRADASDGRVSVDDDGMAVTRPARDHRETVLAVWHAGPGAGESDAAARVGAVLAGDAGIRAEPGEDPRDVLRGCLTALSRHDPVPAALLAFRHGLAGAHHLFRAHRLARGQAGKRAARRVLGDAHAAMATMTVEAARRALRALTG